MRDSGCVACGAEDGDFVGGRAERFHTFIGLLAVVQRGRHAVDAQIGIRYELRRAPFPSFDAVVGFDVAVDCEVSGGDGELGKWRGEGCVSAYLRGLGNQYHSSQLY